MAPDLLNVFILGLLTAIATGIGALPFFFVKEIPRKYTAGLYGLASGIMLSASVLGLVPEGVKYGTLNSVIYGLIAGGLFYIAAEKLLPEHHFKHKHLSDADFKKLFLIIGTLTIHSFPEGFAIGTAYAGGKEIALFMFIAIAIHNIPEGTSISIPMAAAKMDKWKMVGFSIFSSLPQPIGAVIAYYLVTIIKDFLPFSFGFAAGAMVLLVFMNMIPAAMKFNHNRWIWSGLIIGFFSMIPLIIYL